MLAPPDRSTLNSNGRSFKTSAELIEWHKHRLVTTIDQRGFQGFYSNTDASMYSIAKSDGSSAPLSDCAPQCLIS